METTPFSDEIRRYLGLLLQWAWLLILSAVLAGGAAYGISTRMAPAYRASTLILINEAPSNKAVDYTAIMTSERLAKTYAQVMTTRPVLEGVIQRLDMPLDVGALQAAISVKPVRDTQLIQIEVENGNPSMAALLANTLVAEFAEQNLAEQASRFAASKQTLESQLIQLDGEMQETSSALAGIGNDPNMQAERDRLEATLGQYRQTYASLLQSYEQVRLAEAQSTSRVMQKEPAIPPTDPVRPQPVRNTLLAAVVGLMLGVGVIFLVEALDDTLRDPDEAARQLGLPVLGLIARHNANEGKPITAAHPRAPVAEAFRSLRTNLQFAGIDRPLRSLLVTSPSPEDGKSTVASNLAVVLAQGGRPVVVMEADLRRPKVHRKLSLSNREGVSSLFLQLQESGGKSLNLQGCLKPTGVPDLWALTSGSLPPNPAELLGSENMVKILQELSGRDGSGKGAHNIVIDSPPVLAVTDASVLAPRVDGVLLVVKPGATKLAAAKQAVEQLRRVGANILGVVLNDVELKRSRYAYYRYNGYYAYGDANGSHYAEPALGETRNGKQPIARRAGI